jgi:hypothetical protein
MAEEADLTYEVNHVGPKPPKRIAATPPAEPEATPLVEAAPPLVEAPPEGEQSLLDRIVGLLELLGDKAPELTSQLLAELGRCPIDLLYKLFDPTHVYIPPSCVDLSPPPSDEEKALFDNTGPFYGPNGPVSVRTNYEPPAPVDPNTPGVWDDAGYKIGSAPSGLSSRMKGSHWAW